MTYENCLKYMNEAKTEEEKKFWEDRIKRKYPDKIKTEEPKAESKKTKSKENSK